MMNSIDISPLRSDLGDQLVSIELEQITTRRGEAELEREYKALEPRVLGNLLHLLVQVLEVLPTTPTPGCAVFILRIPSRTGTRASF